MRKVIILMFFTFITVLNAQVYKKVELTPEETHFISTNRAGGFFGERNEKSTNDIININNTLFFFEILHNNKIIYTESLRRWNPFDPILLSSRENPAICFKYSDISSDVILQLLEDKKWKVNKVGESRFVCNNSFSIFRDKEKGIINNNKDFTIKLYKLVEQD